MKNIFTILKAQKIKILIGFISIIILIQFKQPERNEGNASSPNDITVATVVSPEIKGILETSCFDCHSDNTNYPWYTNIQPVGWVLEDHVKEGKKELNFSQFATYSIKRKLKKYHEITEQLDEGEMPLNSYLLIHRNAVLNDSQKKLLIDWANNNRILLEKQYPDSVRKNPS